MADNPKLHCCGIVELVPPPQPPAKPSNKRPLITGCAEVERTTRSSHHDGSGGGFATQFDKKHKAEGFVDRTTGRAGFKEEVKYKSTVKVDDKWSGCTDVYSTQVKFKRVTYQPAVKAVPRFKNKRVNYH
ncbi:hypothetical protein ACJRO7_015105 [Eucalyptus globulus]|uniref:Uncharacterized protein n=1 Tax=Eucalyptus globulus TaxID=34317 RepID=A0ABD3L2G4_EUCGL